MALREDVLKIITQYRLTPAQLIEFINQIQFVPVIHIAHAEVELAGKNGCAVVAFPIWTKNYDSILYELDKIQAIKQYGAQTADVRIYQVLWVDLGLLGKVKEILGKYPEARIFI